MNDEPSLQADVAVDEALRAIARAILDDARAAIANPKQPTAEAVHDFRRHMKRWRALLRLLGPILGTNGRALRDEARDLARALGGARDAQSALDALDDLAARNALPKRFSDADGLELHELRKRIVAHRHQMEIVAPLWRRFGKMWIGEAQRLRDRLGKHQDLLLLTRMTEPGEPLARWQARLKPAIEERASDHIRAARRLARRLFVDKPKAFRRRLEVMGETA